MNVPRPRVFDKTTVVHDDRNRARHSRIVSALQRKRWMQHSSAAWLDGGWIAFYSNRPIYAPGVKGVQLEWRLVNRPASEGGGVRTITTIKAWTNA